MTTRHYIAVADLAPGERMWSIVFPDFPGVTSAAAEFADVPQQARDALATAVEHVRGRVPVYAGTGAETTREAVRLTRLAEREGADGLSDQRPH